MPTHAHAMPFAALACLEPAISAGLRVPTDLLFSSGREGTDALEQHIRPHISDEADRAELGATG